MKQKSGGIKRLMEFTGKHRGLLTVSRILSGISSVFILGPFLCVYFAARDLVGVFAGTPLDTNSLVRWGLLALGLELIGLVLYFSALLCSHVVAFHTEKTLKMAALKHLAKMPMGYFDANPSGKLRKIIDDNSFQTETFIAHQLPDLVGAQVTMIVSLVLMLVFDWRVGIPLLLLFGIGFFLQGSLMGKDSMKFMQTYQDSLETMNHEAVEYIRGISVVKVFGQTVQSITKFNDAIKSYRKFALAYTMSCKKGIHPLLYLFVTALIALVAWIPYMYVMAKVPKAGVVLIMNLFVAIAFVAFGELANLLLGSLIVCSILAEIIRKWAGYKNYKGIVMSYILLSLSNIGSPLYVWVFSDYAISEASEEMSANYAEILSTLTSPWFMVLAIAATVVISIIVGVIAKKVYNKQFANAGIM